MWSTDEQDALQLIDRELDIYANEHKELFDGGSRVLHMWDAESGMIDNWHKYCQRQMRDNYHTLDETLIFANTPVKKRAMHPNGCRIHWKQEVSVPMKNS